MLFHSFHFFLFFPLVALLYYAIPPKYRWVWLLVASYYFYMAWNAIHVLLLTAAVAITWLGGRLIQWSGRQEDPKKRAFRRKLWACLSVGGILSILLFFKSFSLLIESANQILAAAGMEAIRPSFDVLLPVGISFYTFKAVSYIIDVYRGHIRAERNFFKTALYLSFFPQLTSGPIERAKSLLGQLDERRAFHPDHVKKGLLLMLWGFFQKLVIADRAALLVNHVFTHYQTFDYRGFQIVVTIFFLAVQLYCDFSGYTDIANGAMQVLGFRQAENFRQPYFATSIQDFWKRWHITLGSWFRDYVFLPLSGKLMKRGWGFRPIYVVSSLAVWFLTGLWHGVSLHFAAWGLLHGIFQIVGFLTGAARKKLYARLHIQTDRFSFRLGQGLVTFSLTCFAWIFFRASGVIHALRLIKRIITTFNPWVLVDGSLYTLDLNDQNFRLLLVAICVLLIVNICQYKGIRLRERLLAQGLPFRWAVYLLGLFSLIIFGMYGPGYNAGAFLYSQF